ncbi:MAG: O-antigen ligase family protein [Anaerolineae bacterium]|nr:O-antigen ligase family protein [Anaerolineae bacterium]
MQADDRLRNWYMHQSSPTRAIYLGLTIGIFGGLIGLLLAVAGPIIGAGAIIGLLAALYILTDVSAALYALIAVMALLPFGTLPFKIVITPTLLDMAVAAFLLVYLFQWMTGRRQRLQLTPVHLLIIVYALWLILSFALGLRYAPPTPNKLRQFAETLMSIGLAFVLVDLIRDTRTLRRVVLVFMLFIGIQALVTLALYILPDSLAERLLVILARIGYPNGGVIRYIEDNPALRERAIGTWVDPNALGGALAISAALIAAHVFAVRPIIRWRWLLIALFAVVGLGLLLTFSRASMLALAAGLLIIAVVRYRQYLPLLLIGGILLLFLPQTQIYLDRFIQAFTAADLATQMRLGEYTDSLRLISRYPIFGVGFTGTPGIDLYTDVASMYLIMANQIGLVGLGIFLTTMVGVLGYGAYAWRQARLNQELDSTHLGLHTALLVLLVNAVADLYFFRLDFQASITLLWLVVGLCLASSRLALQQESTVVKSEPVK